MYNFLSIITINQKKCYAFLRKTVIQYRFTLGMCSKIPETEPSYTLYSRKKTGILW